MIALFFMLMTAAGAGASLSKWLRAEWEGRLLVSAGWFALFLLNFIGLLCWTFLWVVHL